MLKDDVKSLERTFQDAGFPPDQDSLQFGKGQGGKPMATVENQWRRRTAMATAAARSAEAIAVCRRDRID